MKGTMNKNRFARQVFALVATLVLAACGQQESEPGRIDLTRLDTEEARLTARDLFASVEYIPLETRPECLLGSTAIMAVDDSNVLVWQGNDVLRFSRDGSFLNKVGTTGNGHGEHGATRSARYDTGSRTVLIATFDNRIFRYSLDGEYLGDFKMPDNGKVPQTFRVAHDGNLVCEMRDYKEEGLDVWLQVFTPESGELRLSRRIYTDGETVKRSMMKTATMCSTPDGTWMILPFDDWAWCYTPEGKIDSLLFDRGSYSPSRELCENWDNSEELKQTKYQIDNMVGTEKHFYLEVPTKQGGRDVLVDRRTNRVVHNHYWRWGFEDKGHIRLDGFSEDVTFWPFISTGRDGNLLAALMPIDLFAGEDRQTLRKKAQNDYPLNDDSNPILVIAREK